MNDPKLPWQASGWRWLWISAFFIILDQLTKFWIVVGIPEGQQIYVMPVLNIIHTTNCRCGLEHVRDWGGSQRWLLSALAIVMSIVLVVWLRRIAMRDPAAARRRSGADPRRRHRQRHRPAPPRPRHRLHRQRIGAWRISRRSTSPTPPSASVPGCVILDAILEHGARSRRPPPPRKPRAAESRPRCASCWPTRGDSAPASIAPSTSSSAPSRCSARLSTCATKWCTTCTSSSGCGRWAPCSSTSSHQVPDGATVIFSAHGVPAAVENEAGRRGLTVFDATCPLVTKVHMEVARYAREGRDVVLIGHAGHPEVEGTMGRFDTAHGGHMHLIENVEQARRLQVRDPGQAGVRHADHAVGGRHRGDRQQPCASASPRWRARGARTSATRRRTARTR